MIFHDRRRLGAIRRPFVSAGVAYQGPGDIMGSAIAFWGLRAYTLVGIGANAITLRRDGASPTSQTFTTVAGGGLDVTAINTFGAGVNLFVATLFDQTGNGFNQSQGTNGNQPQFFTTGGPNGGPRMVFVAATPLFLGASGLSAQAQPISWTGVFNPVSTGAYQVIGCDASDVFSVNRNASDVAFIAAGGAGFPQAASPGGSYYACNGLWNGASSTFTLNGSSNTANAGTTGIAGGGVWTIGALSGPSDGFQGVMTEQGLWAGDKSGNFTAMTTNQRNFYNF